MNLPLFAPTYTVAQLCDEIREVVATALPRLWVAGEAQRIQLSQNGHLYFELVEKGIRDEIIGRLEAVVWKTDLLRVRKLLKAADQSLVDGVQIRCHGKLEFYGPRGRIQFRIQDVDPSFTLGQLEFRRRQTMAALEAAGLLTLNRGLALAVLPLTIGLITSVGSAAHADFMSGLAESGFGFRVLVVHAAVQGPTAEREIVSALGLLSRRGIDCAALIRGGGARSDLAVFDGRRVAEAIARAPYPVLTGLGHEIDQTIADLVAHQAFKTPTRVAAFLGERVAQAETALGQLADALPRAARNVLYTNASALAHAAHRVVRAGGRLASTGERLRAVARALNQAGRGRLRHGDKHCAVLAVRLGAAGPARLRRALERRGRYAARLTAAGRGHLRARRAILDGRARLVSQLDPQRTLERGFSLTRDTAGKLLREPSQVEAGSLVSTRLAAGSFISRVENP